MAESYDAMPWKTRNRLAATPYEYALQHPIAFWQFASLGAPSTSWPGRQPCRQRHVHLHRHWCRTLSCSGRKTEDGVLGYSSASGALVLWCSDRWPVTFCRLPTLSRHTGGGKVRSLSRTSALPQESRDLFLLDFTACRGQFGGLSSRRQPTVDGGSKCFDEIRCLAGLAIVQSGSCLAVVRLSGCLVVWKPSGNRPSVVRLAIVCQLSVRSSRLVVSVCLAVVLHLSSKESSTISKNELLTDFSQHKRTTVDLSTKRGPLYPILRISHSALIRFHASGHAAHRMSAGPPAYCVYDASETRATAEVACAGGPLLSRTGPPDGSSGAIVYGVCGVRRTLNGMLSRRRHIHTSDHKARHRARSAETFAIFCGGRRFKVNHRSRSRSDYSVLVSGFPAARLFFILDCQSLSGPRTRREGQRRAGEGQGNEQENEQENEHPHLYPLTHRLMLCLDVLFLFPFFLFHF